MPSKTRSALLALGVIALAGLGTSTSAFADKDNYTHTQASNGGQYGRSMHRHYGASRHHSNRGHHYGWRHHRSMKY